MPQNLRISSRPELLPFAMKPDHPIRSLNLSSSNSGNDGITLDVITTDPFLTSIIKFQKSDLFEGSFSDHISSSSNILKYRVLSSNLSLYHMFETCSPVSHSFLNAASATKHF
jgi:hypothetical protein